MEEKENQHCFLCEESSEEVSFQYTEPICEDCLNFKGLTRIEAAIGNKRRLKNKPLEASSASYQFQKRNSKSSGDTDVLTKKLPSGKKLIFRIKKTVSESQIEKETGENSESSDSSNSSSEFSSDPTSVGKDTAQPGCQMKSAKENYIGFVIPLAYKGIEIFKNDNNEKELPLKLPLLTKFQLDQKMTENFARAALKALKCDLSNKKIGMLSITEHSTSTFNTFGTKKLSLKRLGSDSGCTSRKK